MTSFLFHENKYLTLLLFSEASTAFNTYMHRKDSLYKFIQFSFM